MWNRLIAISKKIIAGAAIIAGTMLGEICSLVVLGTPITDPAIKLIVLAVAWQIWDTVIVPVINDLEPKQTASEMKKSGSMKLIG